MTFIVGALASKYRGDEPELLQEKHSRLADFTSVFKESFAKWGRLGGNPATDFRYLYIQIQATRYIE